MKNTFNFAQISTDNKSEIRSLRAKGVTLMDIKSILGLKPWATKEEIIAELELLSK